MTDWTSILDSGRVGKCDDPDDCQCVLHPVSFVVGDGWQISYCGCCGRTWGEPRRCSR